MHARPRMLSTVIGGWILMLGSAAMPAAALAPPDAAGLPGQPDWTAEVTGYFVQASTLAPAVGDLNLDGVDDVCVRWKRRGDRLSCVDGATGGVLWTYRGDPGANLFVPVVGDLDGRGAPEVVTGESLTVSRPGSPPRVIVLNGRNGRELDTWTAPPYTTLPNISVGPYLIADVDGEGPNEILVGTSFDFGKAYALRFDGNTISEAWHYADGTGFAHYPFDARNIDGDPALEVAVQNGQVDKATALVDGEAGSLEWRRPLGVANHWPQLRILAVGTGHLVLAIARNPADLTKGIVRVYDAATGTEEHSSNLTWPYSNRRTFADVDGDGNEEFVAIGSDERVRAFDVNQGGLRQKWHKSFAATWVTPYPGAGHDDLLVGTDYGKVFVVRGTDGKELGSLPAVGEILQVAAVDLDHDGTSEILVSGGELTLWDTGPCAGLVPTLVGTSGNDRLRGTEGNDVILGYGGRDYIFGLGGNDVICAGPGDDVLIGGAGNDRLFGEAGADSIEGGAGDDRIEGGSGSADRAGFGKAPASVRASLTTGRATGEGTDRLIEIENLSGSRHADVLTGDGGDNLLEGLGGDDEIRGNAGDDRLYGSTGADLLIGGEGDDALIGSGGDDTLDGGEGDDDLRGGPDTDRATYGAATTAVTVDLTAGTATGMGSDTLSTIEDVTGSAHADTLSGNAGDNELWGGGGNDVLTGNAGNDALHGEGGADTLNGKAGDDTLDGGVGPDTLRGAAGLDTLDGGAGIDLASFSDLTSSVRVFLKTGRAVTGDGTESITGIEKVYGTDYGDRLEGDDDANWLFGSSGNDTLIGHGGNDSLYGYAGRDYLYGYGGDDYLAGGLDRDVAYGGDGVDHVYGDDGGDSLYGDADRDYLYGGSGDDNMGGGLGNDSLYGGPDDDCLYGNAGNDSLYGHGGDDRIYGNAGTSDYANGGSGIDWCYAETEYRCDP